jgi:VanZ family protein
MILALALYWPVLFVLAHIPVPSVVREANVSDKGLHFLAYAILTFLLWSVVRPESKVEWRRASSWLVLAAVTVYGFADEGLQYFVPGRSADLKDIVADAAGAIVALGIRTFFSFWGTVAVLTAMTVYMLPVLARQSLMGLLPVLTTVFYVGGYTLLTVLWVHCLRPLASPGKGGVAGLAMSVSGPFALLLATTISAWAAGRPFGRWDMVAAAAGILAGIAGSQLSFALMGSERPVEGIADENQLP